MLYKNLAEEMAYISLTSDIYKDIKNQIRKQAEKGLFEFIATYDKLAYFDILPVIVGRLKNDGFIVNTGDTLRSDRPKIWIKVKWN